MGWFSRNRRPLSRAFLSRLDEIEAAVVSLMDRGEDPAPPKPEIIPVEITGEQENDDGVTEYSWRELTKDPNDEGGRSSVGGDDDFAFPAIDPDEGQSFVLTHYIASEETDDEGNTYPLREQRRTLITGASVATFFASIEYNAEEGPTEISGGQWRYPFVEVEYDPALGGIGGWSVMADGRSGDAINTLEAGNDSTLCYGIEVTGADLYIHDTQQKYQFLPVPPGAVVQVRTAPTVGGGTTYAFSAPNPIDGQCEP